MSSTIQLITGKLGVKPQAATDRQLQMAIDDIYRAQHPNSYFGRDVMAITVTPEGRVILSKNGRIPGTRARAKAVEIFNGNVEFVKGLCGDCEALQDYVGIHRITPTVDENNGIHQRIWYD